MTALDHMFRRSKFSLRNGRHPHMDSLDSKRNPPWPTVWSRKILKLSQNFRQGRWGGFQVDSPVKRPDAGKLARSAPPYTDRAREEPWEGGDAPGPDLPSMDSLCGSAQLSHCCHSCVSQHFRRMKYRCADFQGLYPTAAIRSGQKPSAVTKTPAVLEHDPVWIRGVYARAFTDRKMGDP